MSVWSLLLNNHNFLTYVAWTSLSSIGVFWLLSVLFCIVDLYQTPGFLMQFKVQPGKNAPMARLLKALLFAFIVCCASASFQSNSTGAGAASKPSADICRTPECLALSAQITRNMNFSADPCEDFSAYACGNYESSTLYDPGSVTWSKYLYEPSVMESGVNSIRRQLYKRVFELLMYAQRSVNSSDPDINRMYRLARDLFRSCSSWVWQRGQQYKDPNSGRLASQSFFDGVLEHLLDDISSNNINKDSNSTFESALSRMVRLDVWPLVKVGPVIDHSFILRVRPLQANFSSLKTSSSKVRLSLSPDYYSNKTNYSIFTNFFLTLPAASRLNLSNPAQFAVIVQELQTNMTVEDDLSEEELRQKWPNCSIVAELLRSSSMDLTIRQLNAFSRCADPEDPFSWKLFFDGVLDGRVNQDTPIQIRSGPMKTVTYADAVIRFASYFKRRVQSTGPGASFSTHFSFLLVNWMLSFHKYLPADLRVQWLRDHRELNRVPELENDPIDSCILLTKALLPPVVEQMYQKVYHAEYFGDVRRLLELIQGATIQNVLRQDWIIQSAKDAISDKITAMKQQIGFDIVSDEQLKTFYASTIRSLEASGKSKVNKKFGTLFSLALCASAGYLNNMLSSDSQSFSFRFSGLVVNAFNENRKNQIIFPMGILTPFLYHRSFPHYVNLAGIGIIIGHEIGHGFDDVGHELNKLGVRGHFWDNVTEAGYLERMECVISRYGKYEFLPGRLHKSRMTRGNDIADLMGIQAAFRALQLWRQSSGGRQVLRLPHLPDSLTPDRLFFIQAVQAYCSKMEPEVLIDKFQWSRHSPPHIRIRGMIENSEDFARVFQCKPNQSMNPSKKCVFW